MNTPHLDLLAEKFKDTSSSSFFNEWKKIKGYDSAVNQSFYERLDSWISCIPKKEFSTFENKISQVHHIRDQDRCRDWEKLFDTFNESFGFYILKNKYECDEIEFFEQKGKMPDIHGIKGDQHIYLECKTINHSQEEREAWHDESIDLPCIDGLPTTLKKKIKSIYDGAITQLDASPDHSNKKYLVSMIINIDHQISGFPDSEDEMFLTYLNSIEDPEYFIEFLVH